MDSSSAQRIKFFATLTLTTLLLPANLCGQISFTGLGANTNYATAVSSDGSVVVGVGYRPAAFYTEAFRWTHATGSAGLINPPGAFDSRAMGMSANGSVVVGEVNVSPGPGHPPPQPSEAFRWTGSTGLQRLGFQPGGTYSVASDVSGDGSVVVGYGDSSMGATAFRWTASEGFQQIARGWAVAASFDGSIVAGTTIDDSGNRAAYRWSEENGVQLLGSLEAGLGSSATGVSTDGSLVVGASETPDGFEATLWSDATGPVGLGFVGSSTISGARAVSDDGSIVIGIADVVTPFIWTPSSGMRSLSDVLRDEYGLADQLTDWQVFDALGMSPDGRYIVGMGRHGDDLEAWLLDRGLNPPSIMPPPITPIPEPAVYGWAGAIGLVALMIRKNRSQSKRRKEMGHAPTPPSPSAVGRLELDHP
jgi:uncharacterized membrane protein